MQQPIVGFHQDEEQHWVADLACGHSQHVRHDPPWQQRPWVLLEVTRQERLGTTLDCKLCDESSPAAPPSPASLTADAPPAHLSATAAAVYTDARLQGLCHDGALEIAERLDAPQNGS